jgi:hypothetical protein
MGLPPAYVAKRKYVEDVLCLEVLFRSQETLKECQLRLANEFQKCRVGDLLGIGMRGVDKLLAVV